jgi:hydroxymethylbilane synthase
VALRVATRGSELALWQARRVVSLLGGAPAEVVVVETAGDRSKDVPISRIGGQGAFVKEVQAAVLEGRADIAVHSAKDLPSEPTGGLTLGAVPERGDPRDAMVGAALEQLPAGGLVRTGSVRRRAQIANLRPDLTFAELRGNIATRLEKVPERGAVVVAMAALERLGMPGTAAEALDAALVMPQVGQGSLAVECREDDEGVLELLSRIDDARARSALEAERAFMAELGGGCELPVGALAATSGHGAVSIEGMVASLDGRVVLRHRLCGPASSSALLGSRLARELLVERGGALLVEDISSAAGPGT